MRLVVQVPCLNEAETLPSVLEAIPASIDGVDEILVVVIDDGSSDGTTDVAKDHGVHRIIRHTIPHGLARSFHDGVRCALEMGADILVNTDGDNQYPSERIGDLIQPILSGEADIVVADRQVHLVEHFSRSKVLLQHLGSRVVSRVAGTAIPDAASGFRAYSRESLLRLNSVTRFSYSMETIIQAGNKRLAVGHVPVHTNPKTRESRLFKSTGQHVFRSAAAIVRSYIMYKPYAIFGALAMVAGGLGIAPYVRYAVLVSQGEQGGHLQSLLVGAVLLVLAFLAVMLGVVSDLIRTNRILLEAGLEHAKRESYGNDGLGERTT